MKLSDIFKFKLFEGSDKANLKIVNENFEIAEKELAATNKEITDKVTEINNKITELNGLLGGKLDVSKIANNLVTTEEGYALDARMGKALSDKVDDHFKNIKIREIILEYNISKSEDTIKVDLNSYISGNNVYICAICNINWHQTTAEVALFDNRYCNIFIKTREPYDFVKELKLIVMYT